MNFASCRTPYFTGWRGVALRTRRRRVTLLRWKIEYTSIFAETLQKYTVHKYMTDQRTAYFTQGKPPRKHLSRMGIAKWRMTKTFNKAFTCRAVFCRHISDGSTLTRWSGSRDPSHNRFSKYFHDRRIPPPPFWHTKIFPLYPQNLSNWTTLPDVLIWRLQNLFKPMRFIFLAGISR